MLHKHTYKNNSLILTLLSEDSELIRGIYYGGRKKALSLFTCYWVQYIPRENLSGLTQFEALSSTISLKGNALYCGLYLNELLVRLLRRFTADTRLLEDYNITLKALASIQHVEPLLRQFERKLLAYIGYEIEFDRESSTMTRIDSSSYYTFDPAQGFLLLGDVGHLRHDTIFLGKHLLSIACEDYREDDVKRTAKRVMRHMFHYLLQGKTLTSRALFASSIEESSS